MRELPRCLCLIKVRRVLVFDTLSTSRANKAPDSLGCRKTQQNTQDTSIRLSRMSVRAKAMTNPGSRMSSRLRWSSLTAVNTYLMLSLWSATEPWNKARISTHDVCYRIRPAEPLPCRQSQRIYSNTGFLPLGDSVLKTAGRGLIRTGSSRSQYGTNKNQGVDFQQKSPNGKKKITILTVKDC